MSDERLRALERAYRESMCDTDESAYWEAWERAHMPAWATPPWHVRCPSINPRPGDMLGNRLVVAVRDERVVFWRPDRTPGSVNRWALRDCSRETCMVAPRAKRSRTRRSAPACGSQGAGSPGNEEGPAGSGDLVARPPDLA